MPTMADVPAIVRGIDSRLVSIVSSAWGRRTAAGMWWKRLARTRPSETGTEFIQWLLETARLHPMDMGGRNVYSDFAGVNFSITNTEVGDDLRLKAIEILNSLGGQNGAERNALVLAEVWGRQMGGQGAYWPQLKTAGIMVNGATIGYSAGSITTGVAPIAATSYDGQPFFDTGHWINPVTKQTTGGPNANGKFTNLFYGRPLTADNWSLIGAYIESIPGPDGIARKIKPRILCTGSDNRFKATQLLSARSEFMTDPSNPNGTAAATNVTKTLYATEEPIIDPDLNVYGAPAGTWWIACELVEDDQLAPIIYQERLPFALTSYSPQTDVWLAHQESFEWKFRGWNQIATGHPFLMFCCRPDVPSGQTQWSPP